MLTAATAVLGTVGATYLYKEIQKKKSAKHVASKSSTYNNHGNWYGGEDEAHSPSKAKPASKTIKAAVQNRKKPASVYELSYFSKQGKMNKGQSNSNNYGNWYGGDEDESEE